MASVDGRRAGLLVALFALACRPAPQVTELEAPVAPGSQSADPVLATDPVTGDLLLAWVAGDSAGWHVYFARSGNGGATWSSPARVTDAEHDVHPHGESSPRLVATPGAIAVVWTNSVPAPGRKWPGSNIRLSRSTDQGRTWSRVVTLNDDSSAGPGGHIFHGAAWRGDSGIVVAWMDERGGAAAVNAEQESHAGHQGEEAEEPDATIYVASSGDLGKRWAPNRAYRGAACPCCRVAMARDTAGAVVVAWRKHFPGNVRDVVVADLDAETGETRVRADNWVYPGCPHTGPGLTIDSLGTAHITWFKGGPDAAGVYYARAVFGTFGPPVALLQTRTLPTAHPRVAVSGDGGAVVAWDIGADGKPTLFVARIGPNGRAGRTVAVAGSAGADHPEIVTLGNARHIVAWTERRDGVTRVRLVGVTP